MHDDDDDGEYTALHEKERNTLIHDTRVMILCRIRSFVLSLSSSSFNTIHFCSLCVEGEQSELRRERPRSIAHTPGEYFSFFFPLIFFLPSRRRHGVVVDPMNDVTISKPRSATPATTGMKGRDDL